MEVLRASEKQLLALKLKEKLLVPLIILPFTAVGLIPSVRYIVTSSDDILGCSFAAMIFILSISTNISVPTITWQKIKIQNIIDTNWLGNYSPNNSF